MAERARALGDEEIVVVEDEFSALSDEEMSEALAAWLRSVRTGDEPELEFLDAAAAIRAERVDDTR